MHHANDDEHTCIRIMPPHCNFAHIVRALNRLVFVPAGSLRRCGEGSGGIGQV